MSFGYVSVFPGFSALFLTAKTLIKANFYIIIPDTKNELMCQHMNEQNTGDLSKRWIFKTIWKYPNICDLKKKEIVNI